ncbi:MFS transporter [Clostridium sp.]|uniref:MFS transporter n=1 Tax=Clostridium sp. TaxID=1506 RepID=UPI00262E1EB7|nr:MFS transporter [Clostridium sp.]
MKNSKLNGNKTIFIITLGFALGMRQMAMTMVMPFLSVYSKTLLYNTPMFSGIALGIFGLMQAIFQIPYGIWSDKKGNRIVMIVGLFQVILGLVIAYFASNIYMLILARAMQGSGAVIAVGFSWVSGISTNSKERTSYLSIISIIIGVAASSSFAFGPLIHRFVSVKNMFLYSAVLIFISWIVIIVFLNDNNNRRKEGLMESNNLKEFKGLRNENKITTRDAIKSLIRDKNFIAFNLAAFINNFIMIGVFYAIPQYLEVITGIDGMWRIFMPSVIIAVLIMRIALKRLDNLQSIKFLIISFLLCAIGICFYFNKNSFLYIFVGTVLFMTGYISISTIISNLSNLILEDEYRGAGNGIINSFQYIGSFIGSVIVAAAWVKGEALAFIILILISLLGAGIIKFYVKGEDFHER